MRRLRDNRRTIKKQLPAIEHQLKAEEERIKAEQEQIRLEKEKELAFKRAGGEYLDLDVDGDQIAWEIRNFEAMFNGQIAPDMDSFDNMMGAFLGDETSVENGQLLSDFDPSMAGDYAIGSYQYRDEKFAVSIDIRRMAKYMDGDQNFDMFGTESMNLSGIRMVSETGEITFALNGRGEKILIKSDLDSMGNYVAQKTIEGKVYLRTNPEKMLDVDLDKLEIWGVDKKDTNKFRRIASTIADFIPYVGTAKAISELSLGYDYIGGEEVSRVVAVCGIVGTLIPVPGAGKAMKFAGKTVTKIIGNAPDLMKKVTKYPTKYHTRMPAETAVLRTDFYPKKRAEFLKQYADTEEAIKRFSLLDRTILRSGEIPEGWIVHHKHPLFRGGNNDFSNLRVMKKGIHDKHRSRLHFYKKGKNIYGLD